MIIQGLTSSGIALPILIDASGRFYVSLYNFTSDGQPLAVDASHRLKVLLDAQTANLNVNLAASGITLNVQNKGITVSDALMAVDASNRLKVLLDAQTANLNVNLAASGITLNVQNKGITVSDALMAVDASNRLKVLLDAQTANLNVNLAASGVTQNVAITGNVETVVVGVITNVTNLALAAGASVNQDAAVPTSQVYRFTSAAFSYTGTVAGVRLRLRIDVGGAKRNVFEVSPPVSGQLYNWVGDIALNATDKVEIQVTGATLNDDLVADFCYRRVK